MMLFPMNKRYVKLVSSQIKIKQNHKGKKYSLRILSDTDEATRVSEYRRFRHILLQTLCLRAWIRLWK